MGLATENTLNLLVFTDTLATICSFKSDSKIPLWGSHLSFKREASLFFAVPWFTASALPSYKGRLRSMARSPKCNISTCRYIYLNIDSILSQLNFQSIFYISSLKTGVLKMKRMIKHSAPFGNNIKFVTLDSNRNDAVWHRW